MGQTLRCFIALPLPEPVQAACAAAIAQLKPAGPSTRWTAPASIHLTLKFLGEVPRDQLPALQSALASGVADTGSFVLTTGRMGKFGTGRRPRVLWLGVEGDCEALLALRGAVEETCAGQGHPRESRAFHPHLTLGRVKGGPGGAPSGWPDQIAPPAVVSWRVDAVHLYASHLHPSGAKHETLAICSLVTN